MSTVAIHGALAPIFGKFQLPVFTIPFVLTSWAFLLFSTGNGVVTRSSNPLTPEQRVMKLRKKSGLAIANMVKLTAGVAISMDQTKVLEDSSEDSSEVSVVEEVEETKCMTCPIGRHGGKPCRGLEGRGCWTCGLPGHVKGAPVCQG